MQFDYESSKLGKVCRKLSGLGYQEEMPERRGCIYVKKGKFSSAVVTVGPNGDYKIERFLLPGRQLTQAEILNLQPGDPHEYYLYLQRATYPTPTPVWQGRSKLHIQRTTATKKVPSQLAVLAVTARDWAEASWRDVCEDGEVLVEDYSMRIHW